MCRCKMPEECLIYSTFTAKGLLEDSIEYIVLHHLESWRENKLNKVAKATGLTVPQVQMIANLIRNWSRNREDSFF